MARAVTCEAPAGAEAHGDTARIVRKTRWAIPLPSAARGAGRSPRRRDRPARAYPPPLTRAR